MDLFLNINYFYASNVRDFFSHDLTKKEASILLGIQGKGERLRTLGTRALRREA